MKLVQDDPARTAGEGEYWGDSRRIRAHREYDGEGEELGYDPAGLEVGIKASWVNPDYIEALKAKQDPNKPLRDLFQDFNQIFGVKNEK